MPKVQEMLGGEISAAEVVIDNVADLIAIFRVDAHHHDDGHVCFAEQFDRGRSPFGAGGPEQDAIHLLPPKNFLNGLGFQLGVAVMREQEEVVVVAGSLRLQAMKESQMLSAESVGEAAKDGR